MPCLKQSTVIVIAMKNRKDYIQKELIKYGILNFHLIDAIDGKTEGENYLQNHLISNVGKIDIPASAEIVYLGGFYDKKDKTKNLQYTAGLNQIISEDIKFYTSHSYYVTSPSDLYKNCINKRPKAWDAFLITYIQKRNRCYFFTPSLINQAPWLPSNIDSTTKYSKKKYMN